MLMSLNEPVPPASSSVRTVSVAWVVVIALVVAGGAIAATAAVYALKPTSSPAPSAPGTPASVNLTDDLGRRVTVPYDPARIAVLSPSIMDIVYRLGLRSHVVGVDCYASLGSSGLAEDYSPDQIALWGLNGSMCVEVGPTFAPETLVALDPQLVLASTIVSVAAVEQITSELHIPVVMLQPPTLSGILVDDDLVAQIFGVTSTANALNDQLASALYNATNASANVYTFPTVLVTYSVDSNGYWTFGPGTFGQSLIEICGGTSISANSTTAYPELSPAQVLIDEPQYIVYGTGFGLNESTYAAGPDWTDFSAVQNGNVTGLDSNWLTEPDPTMILDGIPALQAVFYAGAD
jgi:iron complex transport system substrate-binding protein